MIMTSIDRGEDEAIRKQKANERVRAATEGLMGDVEYLERSFSSPIREGDSFATAYPVLKGQRYNFPA
jgi:hypothetical protein